MKKTLTLISIITLISFYAKAQDSEPQEYVKSYISLFTGFSKPMGNFAKSDYNNNQAGFAKRSVTVGLEGAVYVYKNLAIGGVISFQDQGELTLNDAQALSDGYNNIFKVNSTLVQAVDRYHNINYMLGPQYSFTFSKFIVDVRANAGIVKSSSTPELTIYISGQNSSSQTIIQASSKGSAFAYGGQAALRWEFADGWDLGLRLNYVNSSGIAISTTGDTAALGTNGRLVTKLPINEIQATFGIGVHF